MHRFLSVAFLALLLAPPALAQIEMDDASGGNVGVGAAPETDAKLYVLNAASGTTTVGAAGEATGGTTRIGLYGEAAATAGINAYGVYGTFTADYESAPGNHYAGYFNGNVRVLGSVITGSDARFKTDVRPLSGELGPGGESILARVLLLQPRAYRYTDEETYRHLNLPSGEHFGLVAQEVEAVFPEVVSETVHPSLEGEPELTYASVDYVALIPVLVQAVQEQQAEIEALRVLVGQLTAPGN